jgi:TonB-linked SusC/RagA family outer membrane protein
LLDNFGTQALIINPYLLTPMKFICCLACSSILLLISIATHAQNQVSGVVSDAETGELLPGVAVLIKGTTVGVTTDIDGNYILEFTNGTGSADTLVFSYLGYQKQTIPIQGRSVVNVRLASDQELLDEVVVTAIGIKKEKRKVGYSVTEVGGNELIESRETNVINALNGKVAGVQITSTSGSPGASAAIRIRGNQSINGANDPLIVIDGIPVDNSYRGSNFTDQANRALDINPDDIESMSVLKGGAASALYGLRAANGAIIINTKQGREGKTEVTFSTTTTLDQVNKLPQKQLRWAQGAQGNFDPSTNLVWGPLISESFYDTTGMRLVPAGDPASSGRRAESFDDASIFFRTGVTLNNNLSIRGGNAKSGFFLSMSDLRQSGVIPLTDFSRTSFRATANTAITDKLDVKFSANYIRSVADRAQRGSNLSGVMLGLMRSPPSYDLTNGSDDPVNDPSAYSFPDGTQRTYFDAYDNPYWSINKNRNEEELNRLIGFVEFNWRPTPWMTITERFGVDTYAEQRKSYWDRESNEFKDLGGAIFDQNTNQFNLTNDLFVTMEHSFSEDFNAQVIIGHSYQGFQKTFYNVDGFDFVIDDFYDMSNVASINVIADDFLDRSTIIGLFGDLSLDYKRTYYLSITGRQDWSSTLPPNNNSFFYPSVSAGFVFTEVAQIPGIEYGKLRTSFASTGNDAFQNYLTSNFFVSGGSTQGQLSYFPSSTIGNNELRPEFTNSFEIGTDLRTYNNRVRLDFTYYHTSSVDQIVVIPIANSTGYSSFVTNIGEITNQGFEILLSADILERKLSKPNNLGWTSSINFTRNRSEVVSLTDDLDNIALPSVGLASTQSRVIVGEQYGVLFGSRWARNADGRVLVDDNGYPITDSENGVVGDPNPDFIAGWRNTFTWRNLSLSFLLDIRVGGDMYNGTKGVMKRLGSHEETESREETFVWDGVFASTGEENDIPISRDQSFYDRYGLTGVSEDNIEEVNWLRMRDVNLTYTFSPTFCQKLKIARASVTLTARNLFLITNYTGIDPETSLGGASNAFGRDYFNNPNTRSYGVNLSVTF